MGRDCMKHTWSFGQTWFCMNKTWILHFVHFTCSSLKTIRRSRFLRFSKTSFLRKFGSRSIIFWAAICFTWFVRADDLCEKGDKFQLNKAIFRQDNASIHTSQSPKVVPPKEGSQSFEVSSSFSGPKKYQIEKKVYCNGRFWHPGNNSEIAWKNLLDERTLKFFSESIKIDLRRYSLRGV